MMTRRIARRAALQLLYQADLWSWRGLDDEELLDMIEGWVRDAQPSDGAYEYVIDVVCGVRERLSELDALIAAYAVGWPLERLAVVDKNILRLALYEVLHRDDIPVPVTMNEAVELSKRYATPETARFVNGILAAVKRDLESGRLRVGEES